MSEPGEEQQQTSFVVAVLCMLLFAFPALWVFGQIYDADASFLRKGAAYAAGVGVWTLLTPLRKSVARYISSKFVSIVGFALGVAAMGMCVDDGTMTFEECVDELHRPDSYNSTIAQNVRYMVRETGSVHDAEDIVQETIIKVCTKAGEKEVDHLPSYFTKATKNELSDRRRKAKSHRNILDKLPQDPSRSEEMDPELERELLEMEKAWESLTLRQQKILKMRYPLGQEKDTPWKQVAAQMGEPGEEDTIRQQAARARKVLEKRMLEIAAEREKADRGRSRGKP